MNRTYVIELPELTGDLIIFIENQISPQTILGLSVTPLIFEAAFHLGWEDLWRDFILVAGGGLIIGMKLGWLVSQIIKNINDPLIETTLTTVLAFGTYLIAEQLEVSGILAVVSAGLVCGNVGPRGMSPTTRILVTNFWEYMAFISNSILFLLIGLVIDITELASKGQSILLAILAVLLARAIIVYGLSWLGRNIPLKRRHVLFWGGLRGAILLALALSLPLSLESQVHLTL